MVCKKIDKTFNTSPETKATCFVVEKENKYQKMWNASRICVSSLRRGHANLLCIVPILVYVVPKQLH